MKPISKTENQLPCDSKEEEKFKILKDYLAASNTHNCLKALGPRDIPSKIIVKFCRIRKSREWVVIVNLEGSKKHVKSPEISQKQKDIFSLPRRGWGDEKQKKQSDSNASFF